MKDDLLSWIGGFFDGEGSMSFSQGSPSISVVNTDAVASYLIVNTLKSFGVQAKINERSQPSKSSKKKRWDVFINQAEEVFNFCTLMKPYVFGKQKQLSLIEDYKQQRKDAKDYHKKMMFLNQTSNIVTVNGQKLIDKLGFIPSEEYEEYNSQETKNTKIDKTTFNNIHYVAGVIDAEGTINIHMRKNKHRNTDRFTPQIILVNTNKIICSNALSTFDNNNIGCHVQMRIPTERNRLRWDLSINGLGRVHKACKILIDKLRIKHKQCEIMLSYVSDIINEPKSINTTGYDVKMAIQSLR